MLWRSSVWGNAFRGKAPGHELVTLAAVGTKDSPEARARWRRWIGDPWVVVGLTVVGGPGLLDSVRSWVDVFGVNVLVTVALMGLSAHVTAVGFRSWEPYRSWLRRGWRRLRRDESVPVTLGFVNEPSGNRFDRAEGEVVSLATLKLVPGRVVRVDAQAVINGLDESTLVEIGQGDSLWTAVEVPETHHAAFHDGNAWLEQRDCRGEMTTRRYVSIVPPDRIEWFTLSLHPK